jgi:hypothetical protein
MEARARCSQPGVHWATVRRTPRHATVSGYNSGCRCDRCRAAIAAYRRDRRRAAASETLGGKGTASAISGRSARVPRSAQPEQDWWEPRWLLATPPPPERPLASRLARRLRGLRRYPAVQSVSPSRLSSRDGKSTPSRRLLRASAASGLLAALAGGPWGVPGSPGVHSRLPRPRLRAVRVSIPLSPRSGSRGQVDRAGDRPQPGTTGTGPGEKRSGAGRSVQRLAGRERALRGRADPMRVVTWSGLKPSPTPAPARRWGRLECYPIRGPFNLDQTHRPGGCHGQADQGQTRATRDGGAGGRLGGHPLASSPLARGKSDPAGQPRRALLHEPRVAVWVVEGAERAVAGVLGV